MKQWIGPCAILFTVAAAVVTSGCKPSGSVDAEKPTSAPAATGASAPGISAAPPAAAAAAQAAQAQQSREAAANGSAMKKAMEAHGR